jgi:hypothetical protein
MGATLEQTEAAIIAVVPEQASATHPGREDRLQALTLGWTDGGTQGTPQTGQPQGQEVAVGIPERPSAMQPQSSCDGVEVSIGTGGGKCIKPGSGESFKDCAECPEMVIVPSGEFLMGSAEGESGREGDEGPQHKVTIRGFAAGRTHVTRKEFAAFIKATNYSVEGGCLTYSDAAWRIDISKSWHSPGFEQSDDHPVVCVSWDNATAYAAWLSAATGKPYRLLARQRRNTQRAEAGRLMRRLVISLEMARRIYASTPMGPTKRQKPSSQTGQAPPARMDLYSLRPWRASSQILSAFMMFTEMRGVGRWIAGTIVIMARLRTVLPG